MKNFSKEYARALYSLASEENNEKRFLEELKQISGILEKNPDYIKLLSSPQIKKEERILALDQAFAANTDKYILNFMKILTEKREMHIFKSCFDEYRKIYNDDNDILEVIAITAVELSEALREKLTLKLETMTGKNIVLICRVDPECIGGVKLIYGGIQIDASVKSRFERLRSYLKSSDCPVGESW